MGAHLQSDVLNFKGDRRLEACLNDNSAHILQGDAGEHVLKIQKAIMMLDRVSIAPNEVKDKSYGPSTASAVLKYKQKRSIINTSYQSQADDIVGKMTIESIDHELANRFPFQPVSPSDIFIPHDDPIVIPNTSSPKSLNFRIRMFGGISAGEGIAGDLLFFQIWDISNKLAQKYTYFGMGLGLGLSDIAGAAKIAALIAKLPSFARIATKLASLSGTTAGPFNDFSTIKPVPVGIFAGPGHWTSGGGGPFTINILQLFFIAGEASGVQISINTGFTVGVGVGTTFGFMMPVVIDSAGWHPSAALPFGGA
jgi:hypothetical protein